MKKNKRCMIVFGVVFFLLKSIDIQSLSVALNNLLDVMQILTPLVHDNTMYGTAVDLSKCLKIDLKNLPLIQLWTSPVYDQKDSKGNNLFGELPVHLNFKKDFDMINQWLAKGLSVVFYLDLKPNIFGDGCDAYVRIYTPGDSTNNIMCVFPLVVDNNNKPVVNAKAIIWNISYQEAGGDIAIVSCNDQKAFIINPSKK